MEAQYYVLGSRINLYFQEYKLASEIDHLITVTEVLIVKLKNKNQYRRSLTVNLLELILMKINSKK